MNKGKNTAIFVVECLFQIIMVFSILFVTSCSRKVIENAKYSDRIRNEVKSENAIRSKSDIWEQVEPVTYELKRIYESSFPAGRRPKGEIRIKFAVDAYGKIIYFEKLISSFENTEFEKEVIERLKKLSFPDFSRINPADVTEVVFPFRFIE
ncbi:MAG: hypothetical protein GXY77_01035 [Fibrobacter sp.]|nr:hypothetical protein [Fibrobacter sp.]